MFNNRNKAILEFGKICNKYFYLKSNYHGESSLIRGIQTEKFNLKLSCTEIWQTVQRVFASSKVMPVNFLFY
jgi:hypothetical protein